MVPNIIEPKPPTFPQGGAAVAARIRTTESFLQQFFSHVSLSYEVGLIFTQSKPL